jgi:hypothetical protein
MVILDSDRQILVQAPAEESSVGCRTPWMDAEVIEDSVTPCLAPQVRDTASGHETPVQGGDWPCVCTPIGAIARRNSEGDPGACDR